MGLDALGYSCAVPESANTCVQRPPGLRGLSWLKFLCERFFIPLVEAMVAGSHIAIDFTPGRFQGDLLLFIATLDQPEDAPTPDTWRSYVDGKIEIHDIASRDDHMTQSGPLAQIGLILAAKLHEVTNNLSPLHWER